MKMRCIILHVQDDPPEGVMPNYTPQVATIQEYYNFGDAAEFNVGNYPDAEARSKPYRVVVIPESNWHEFEVFVETIKDQQRFKAYESEHPTMKRPEPDDG